MVGNMSTGVLQGLSNSMQGPSRVGPAGTSPGLRPAGPSMAPTGGPVLRPQGPAQPYGVPGGGVGIDLDDSRLQSLGAGRAPMLPDMGPSAGGPVARPMPGLEPVRPPMPMPATRIPPRALGGGGMRHMAGRTMRHAGRR